MNVQIITAPNGERMAVLPESEFLELLSAAEDAIDREVFDAHRRAMAEGREEMIPSDVVHRFLSGENPIRVWREHRGLSVDSLAFAAGIPADQVIRIEAGDEDASPDVLEALARALNLTIDDLV